MTRQHDLNRRRMRAAKKAWKRRGRDDFHALIDFYTKRGPTGLGAPAEVDVYCRPFGPPPGFIFVRDYASDRTQSHALANGEIGQYSGGHRFEGSR